MAPFDPNRVLPHPQPGEALMQAAKRWSAGGASSPGGAASRALASGSALSRIADSRGAASRALASGSALGRITDSRGAASRALGSLSPLTGVAVPLNDLEDRFAASSASVEPIDLDAISKSLAEARAASRAAKQAERTEDRATMLRLVETAERMHGEVAQMRAEVVYANSARRTA